MRGRRHRELLAGVISLSLGLAQGSRRARGCSGVVRLGKLQGRLGGLEPLDGAGAVRVGRGECCTAGRKARSQCVALRLRLLPAGRRRFELGGGALVGALRTFQLSTPTCKYKLIQKKAGRAQAKEGVR